MYMLWLIFLFQLIFIFPLFWGMVMCSDEFKTKEKQKLTKKNEKLTATYKLCYQRSLLSYFLSIQNR